MPSPGGNKKSPWPWILGGCGGCLVLIVIAFLVLAAIGYTARRAAVITQGPVSPQAGMISFTNQMSNTPDSLKPYYTRFSFQYPTEFNLLEDHSNFVKGEEEEEGFTLENFAVGYMTATPGMSNEQAYPVLMQQLSQQIAQGFQGYQELGQFPESVGGVRGRGMRWTALARNTPKGDVRFMGHVILARKEGQPHGVAIIMIATNLDEEVKSPEDVGVKGDLARILPTFRLE
jgi:hypothetical protein